tara:strand:+ start:19680 stop:20687 length:1008 start_codon:yes stop_codon:yes gene_type:complete
LNKKQILVTGGTGYLGSHICLELLANDYELLVIDNLVNSKISTINFIEDISLKKFKFYQIDIRDNKAIKEVFSKNNISAVVHLAALKSISESLIDPYEYYDVNVSGLITLLRAMENHGVKNLIFSSSAVVYGRQAIQPITEQASLCPENPYAFTKSIGEEIISSLVKEKKLIAGVLRYFNPAGSHESGLIGDKPNKVQGNVIPKILDVILGNEKVFKVYGSDYETIDGTGVRDYIHVKDLSRAHILSLQKILNDKKNHTLNIGTGKGYSVLDLIKAFEAVLGEKIPHVFEERREGDVAECFTETSLARDVIGFQADKDINDMVSSALNFAKNYSA